jgi:hypothetical protein
VFAAAWIDLTPGINRALGVPDSVHARAKSLTLAGFRRVNDPHPLPPLDGYLDVEDDASILHVPS